ncbi:MAG: UvrD-helicase domain-containing protein, partial [Desulfosarcina sp.]|nr:UvrD-helicase domain-containing protein [Desulfosarcina sp.]MBC2767087.1 UvrD-helicase domain-containing protein [Desulfosarcina sp.]
MSRLPSLVMVPAGAGSGKTYRIKEQLADWVESGMVRPDRIAAVTFTETAASELRNRIRTTLMARDRIEDALRLDQSFITTIHGFGNRLLVEYAFEAQCCPASRLLGEDEEGLLLRKAIARIERIESISRRLELFGYRYDFVSQTDSAGLFRNRILECVQMLRVIGGDLHRSSRLGHALRFIEQTYGPTEAADVLTIPLRRSIGRLLKKYPTCMRDFVKSDSAKTAVEADFRWLQEADGTSALDFNWLLWKKLQELKVFKTDKQLPADYQDLAREVKAHAGELCTHPGPLADAQQHAAVLLESAWDALADYAQRKRDRGIIDYTDMIDLARQLLDIPEVREHAARRFDCLVIDEFQDTNPLQFSLLWRLHQQGVPALVVGDVKQSIMGFQSADPRLMRSLMVQHREQCQPLNSNWRSQAPLMEVVNAIGDRMFGDHYTRLVPQAPFTSQLSALDAISFEGKGINAKVQAQHVAARIKAILSDNRTLVYDPRLKQHRPVRGEDIAILGLTHNRLKTYAEVLTAIGIRSQLEQDGWFSSRPVQLLYHGLSLVADPGDRHAALYLAVTELGNDDLSSATATLMKGERLNLPLLDLLETIANDQDDLGVEELVAQTIDAMALYDVISTWPDAGQARANLLRFQAEADAFVKADREALAGGGFYGAGLKTFLAWLRRILEEKNGDRQPAPHVHDEEAVQLVTWHAAKGMEWPIVVVTTLDRDVKGRLPSLDIAYTGFKDLNAVLDNARIEFSPGFAAKETNERFESRLDAKAREEGLNLLYVALTRAREQLLLEWPQNLASSTRYTFWHLLCDTAKMRLEANQMWVGDTSFGCRVTAADKEPPADFEQPATPLSSTLPVLGRRALQAEPPPAHLTPAFLTPSSLHGQEMGQEPLAVTTIEYGPPVELTLSSGAERGLIVHRALELLCQEVPSRRARQAVGLSIDDADWQALQSTAKRFMETMSARFQPTALHWEVPIVAADKAGSVINGTIDLLFETNDGYWIIDHKSDET